MRGNASIHDHVQELHLVWQVDASCFHLPLFVSRSATGAPPASENASKTSVWCRRWMWQGRRMSSRLLSPPLSMYCCLGWRHAWRLPSHRWPASAGALLTQYGPHLVCTSLFPPQTYGFKMQLLKLSSRTPSVFDRLLRQQQEPVRMYQNSHSFILDLPGSCNSYSFQRNSKPLQACYTGAHADSPRTSDIALVMSASSWLGEACCMPGLQGRLDCPGG